MTTTRRTSTTTIQLEETDRPNVVRVSITANGLKWTAAVASENVVATVLEHMGAEGMLEHGTRKVLGKLPDWRSEAVSSEAAKFARANMSASLPMEMSDRTEAAVLALLSSAFDAGRRFERE